MLTTHLIQMSYHTNNRIEFNTQKKNGTFNKTTFEQIASKSNEIDLIVMKTWIFCDTHKAVSYFRIFVYSEKSLLCEQLIGGVWASHTNEWINIVCHDWRCRCRWNNRRNHFKNTGNIASSISSLLYSIIHCIDYCACLEIWQPNIISFTPEKFPLETEYVEFIFLRCFSCFPVHSNQLRSNDWIVLQFL